MKSKLTDRFEEFRGLKMTPLLIGELLLVAGCRCLSVIELLFREAKVQKYILSYHVEGQFHFMFIFFSYCI